MDQHHCEKLKTMKKILLVVFVAALAIDVHAISVSLAWSIQPSCTSATGALDIYAIGGTPPYSFVWSNGATTEDLVDLLPGYYEVTVTDALLDQATVGWTLVAYPYLTSPGSAQDGHASCTGSMSGQVQVIEYGINGIPPYSYSPPPDGFDPQGDPYFIFLGTPPGSDVQIQVTDATGCTGTLTQYILGPQIQGGPDMLVTGIQGSCATGSGGAVTISNINDGSFLQAPDGLLLNSVGSTLSVTNNVGNTLTLSGLAPGNYQFYRDWDPFDYIMAYDCFNVPFDRIDFTIPDLGADCGSVSGTVFIDNDQDCIQDPAEVGVPYQVLEVLPGPQYVITDLNGTFSTDILNGSYTLGQTDPNLIQLCPAGTPVPFNVNFGPVMVNLADSSTVPLDLEAQLETSTMRPGFAGTFYGRVRNLSTQLSGPGTIVLDLDLDLVLISANPTPTAVNGNSLTWDLASLSAFQILDLTIHVQVPPGTPLGTPLSSTLSVQNSLTESSLANNTWTTNSIVVGSYDPNDKIATTSSGLSTEYFYIDGDEWIDYTIRFQNTGTDTAFTVVVTDTLSPVLDMASFQQGVASHSFVVSFRAGRVVEWRFENILLPDSNVNETSSHGLVNFRVKPQLPLFPGTTIENTANIYFDFNDPVITEPSVLVAEFSTGVGEQVNGGQLLVMPNPTEGQLMVRRSGDDLRPGMLVVRGIDGRTMLEQRMLGSSAMLNMEALAAGVYMLEHVTDNGSRTTVRFVKQ